MASIIFLLVWVVLGFAKVQEIHVLALKMAENFLHRPGVKNYCYLGLGLVAYLALAYLARTSTLSSCALFIVDFLILLTFFEWHTLSAELQKIQMDYEYEGDANLLSSQEESIASGRHYLPDKSANPLLYYYISKIYRRITAVLFWYAVFSFFGISSVGIVLYYFLDEIKSEEVPASIANLRQTLWYWGHWLAVRATGFIFALVGDFNLTWSNYRQLDEKSLQDHEAVLRAISLGGVGVKLPNLLSDELDSPLHNQNKLLSNLLPLNTIECISSLRALVLRSLILWLVLVFIFNKT